MPVWLTAAAAARGSRRLPVGRGLERLRTQGPCPAGFAWFRSGNGWRCGGGSHFVFDDDPILGPD